MITLTVPKDRICLFVWKKEELLLLRIHSAHLEILGFPMAAILVPRAAILLASATDRELWQVPIRSRHWLVRWEHNKNDNRKKSEENCRRDSVSVCRTCNRYIISNKLNHPLDLFGEKTIREGIVRDWEEFSGLKISVDDGLLPSRISRSCYTISGVYKDGSSFESSARVGYPI